MKQTQDILAKDHYQGTITKEILKSDNSITESRPMCGYVRCNSAVTYAAGSCRFGRHYHSY